VRRAAGETTIDRADSVWVDAGGRRRFVVGWASGGAAHGVFEEEMDAVMNDLDTDGRDQPTDVSTHRFLALFAGPEAGSSERTQPAPPTSLTGPEPQSGQSR
jgi:hypothetical protein